VIDVMVFDMSSNVNCELFNLMTCVSYHVVLSCILKCVTFHKFKTKIIMDMNMMVYLYVSPIVLIHMNHSIHSDGVEVLLYIYNLDDAL